MKSCVRNLFHRTVASNLGAAAVVAFLLAACAQPVKISPAPQQIDEAPKAYRIQPGDTLYVAVWGEEALQRAVLVQPDGGFSFPLAGQMKVEGLSIGELEQELDSRLAPYIPEPAVSVSLVETLGNRIYVMGRVNKPGEHILGRPVDVLQALALAGGLDPFARQDAIKIFRGQAPTQQVFGFNYKEVKRGSNLSQNITLLPGDTIIVP